MQRPVDVSVVVATRNRATLLPACLESLQKQRTDARFEVIVVDNGSQDITAQVATSWAKRDPRVRLVAEPVVGLSRAKNAGIDSASGDIVLFTDDDVVLSDRWIDTFVEFFSERRTELLLAGGPVLPIAHDLTPWPAWISAGGAADLPRLYHGDQPRRLGEFDWLWGANMGARKELFDVLGGFDEAMGVSGEARGTFEDVELVRSVAAHGGECWYLPGAVLHHRTPQAAARPRVVAGKAFNRGANDVLRDRRGSYFEATLSVPRAPIAGTLAIAPLLGAWVLAAAAFRVTRSPHLFELVRRSAWAAGWCVATATERAGRTPARRRRRLALLGRAIALRATPT